MAFDSLHEPWKELLGWDYDAWKLDADPEPQRLEPDEDDDHEFCIACDRPSPRIS